jgi:hypothetical protein
MESAEHRLAARARRAYEIGRLRWATRVAWVVLLLVAVSFAAVGGSPVSAATGALLLVTATALRWRGGASTAAAVRAGLAAGLIPFALLLTLKCGGALCMVGDCMTHCARFCAFGGLAAGVLLAVRARHHRDHVAGFLIAASAVAALTGLLGCFVGGLTGMAWMVMGELVATLPAFAVELRRH